MDENVEPVEWSVIAVNLPEHARNAIHTDAGARAAGFPRGLVAGVSTYAYLAHPLIVWGGLEWIRAGGGELRLRRPVFDNDPVRCVPTDADPFVIHALTAEPDQPRAMFHSVPRADPSMAMRRGESLPDVAFELRGEWGPDYGRRLGDDHELCEAANVVHPAVWPSLANQVFQHHVARGAWIHTRSIIRHHDVAHGGETAVVKTSIVRRFEQGGERAVADMHIEVAGKVVASLEHEAIVALPAG